MSKKILVIVVATGPYYALGLRFINKWNMFYKDKSEISFAFFSNIAPTEAGRPSQVAWFDIPHGEWANIAHSKIKNPLIFSESDYDYIYVFDADTNICKDFYDKDFLGSLVALEHFDNNQRMLENKDYDRNKDSMAYIPYETTLPQTYYQTCMFGGEKDILIKALSECMSWSLSDSNIDYMPRWADEGYLNKYFHYNPPTKTLTYESIFFTPNDKGFGQNNETAGANSKIEISDTDLIQKKIKSLNGKPWDILDGKIVTLDAI